MPIKSLSEIGKPRKRYLTLDRPSASQRGYTYDWQRYSKQFRVDHPLCAHCGEKQSKHVNHIKPVTGPDDPLFWDPSNHEALCHGCHNRETRRTGGGRKYTRKVR